MQDTQQENAKNLKNLGLKATGPRLKILEIFQERAKAGEDRHLSAEEVYKELVNVGEDARKDWPCRLWHKEYPKPYSTSTSETNERQT